MGLENTGSKMELVKESLWDGANLDELYNSVNLGIDFVSIGGGGAKGILLVGAMKALETRGISKTVKYWAGSSVGALFCLMMSSGATSSYTEQIVMSLGKELVDFSSVSNNLPKWIKTVMDSSIAVVRAITDNGLAKGDEILSLVQRILVDFGMDKNATFEDHYKHTGRTLIVTGTEIETGETVYFSRHMSPDFSVAHAVRASMSVPGLFKPITVTDPSGSRRKLVDGGVRCNYPLNIYDYYQGGTLVGVNRHCLLFMFTDIEVEDTKTTKSTTTFLKELFRVMNSPAQDVTNGEYFWNRVILLESLGLSTLNTSVTRYEKQYLISMGHRTTIAQLDHREAEIKKHGGFPRALFAPSHKAKVSGISVPDEKLYSTCVFKVCKNRGVPKTPIPL
jgi:predicted acylesterase/phospholipase RssA